MADSRHVMRGQTNQHTMKQSMAEMLGLRSALPPPPEPPQRETRRRFRSEVSDDEEEPERHTRQRRPTEGSVMKRVMKLLNTVLSSSYLFWGGSFRSVGKTAKHFCYSKVVPFLDVALLSTVSDEHSDMVGYVFFRMRPDAEISRMNLLGASLAEVSAFHFSDVKVPSVPNKA